MGTGSHAAPARLEVRGLRASRGPATLFKNLAFSVEAGEAVAIRGPNGSGKTTLLRCVAGLLRPDAGEVLRSGAVLYAGHLAGIKDEFNAVENLDFALRLQGLRPDPEVLRGALAAVGLEARRFIPARRLSAGQRRRITLARLALDPSPLWLLDEPLAALDTQGEALLCERLAAHLTRGGLALVSTHHDLPVPGHAVRELRIAP
jgi:heme exporter protein A